MSARTIPSRFLPAILSLMLLLVAACSGQEEPRIYDDPETDESQEQATIGGGCFWCVEAVFHRLQGVSQVVSGYAGGEMENPTYEDICTGRTGHAEVCQITFDPEKVSYSEILAVFFATHDPTTVDRQGNDKGPQYRSIILYHDETQRQTAEEVKERIDASGEYDAPIVTQIVPWTIFYPAEKYHQDYFENNRDAPYCTYVVGPKVEKFRKLFKEQAKER